MGPAVESPVGTQMSFLVCSLMESREQLHVSNEIDQCFRVRSVEKGVILNWPERIKTQPHDDRDICFLPFDSKAPAV